jgi:hypothetical protein
MVRQPNLPTLLSFQIYSTIFKYFHLTGDKPTFCKANGPTEVGSKDAICNTNVRAIPRIKAYHFTILNGNPLQRYLGSLKEMDLSFIDGGASLIFLKGQILCREAAIFFYDYGGALVMGELSRPFEDEVCLCYCNPSPILPEGGPGQLHFGTRTNLHATPTLPYAKLITLYLSFTLYPHPYLPEPCKTDFPKGEMTIPDLDSYLTPLYTHPLQSYLRRNYFQPRGRKIFPLGKRAPLQNNLTIRHA